MERGASAFLQIHLVQSYEKDELMILLKKNLFLTLLGPLCCAGIFLVMESGACSLVEICRLLTVVASLVAENGL